MSGNLKLNTPSAGSVTLSTADTASNVTVTIPAATDTATLNAQTQTLTNKTLVASGSNTVEATSGPTATQLAGNRNKIINGAMMIDQRNAGASVTPTDGQYVLDRWRFDLTAASKLTFQQNQGSVTPPTGFTKYAGMTSSSAYSISSGDIFAFSQLIEGNNISDLSWGTANAKTVILSFQVYSSLTGTFGGALRNNDNTRSYPFSYSIPVANTWTSISIIIAGETSGTWVTTNGIGIKVVWGLGVGSALSGTAGAWANAQYWSATGATSVVGTNGATFYITGVQLEKGATATPFENRLYGTELALCQRYCEIWPSVSSVYINPAPGYGPNYIAPGPNFQVTKRTTPTVTTYGVGSYPNNAGYYDKDGSGNTSVTVTGVTQYSFRISGLSSPYSGQFGFKAECEL